MEQLETEKQESEKKLKEISGGPTLIENVEKMKRLEQDLNVANEVAARLQKELDETNVKLTKAEEAAVNKSNTKTGTKDDGPSGKKKTPSVGAIGKLTAGDKMSRESLTRGGSQEDPVQLLRDLQDCLEREADLREQLRFAEEEAENLRKKTSRVEDDNESLVNQLKKMASKTKTKKLGSLPATKIVSESLLETDEGISEDDDPSELKLLLELSEQEASVLRRKIEDMELELQTTKRKLKDTQTKLSAKSTVHKKISNIAAATDGKTETVRDQKMKVSQNITWLILNNYTCVQGARR